MVPRLNQFSEFDEKLTLNQVSFVPHVLQMSFEVFPVLRHTVWRYINMAWSTLASPSDRQEVLVTAISCKVSLTFGDISFFELTAILLDEVDDVVILFGTRCMVKVRKRLNLRLEICLSSMHLFVQPIHVAHCTICGVDVLNYSGKIRTSVGFQSRTKARSFVFDPMSLPRHVRTGNMCNFPFTIGFFQDLVYLSFVFHCLSNFVSVCVCGDNVKVECP